MLEVHATARIIVQRYWYTRKFVKHIVALIIKYCENFIEVKLIRFLCKDPISKILEYIEKLDETTFSNVRELLIHRFWKSCRCGLFQICWKENNWNLLHRTAPMYLHILKKMEKQDEDIEHHQRKNRYYTKQLEKRHCGIS